MGKTPLPVEIPSPIELVLDMLDDIGWERCRNEQRRI
jgi:hypothetical protein